MPRYTQPRKTWCYSMDFKAKAVELSLQEGIEVRKVAEGLDIHPLMLELLLNLVYSNSSISGGLPADFPFINPVNELYSRDHVRQLLETA